MMTLSREDDLEARLLNVIQVYEDLRAEKKALEAQIVNMTLEHSNVIKELANRRIKIAQYDKLAEELAEAKKENGILRSLIQVNIDAK